MPVRRADRALTELGDALEDARKVLGISQREAARRAGISATTWANLVRGAARRKSGGVLVLLPSRPEDDTVISAGTAVGLMPADVLAMCREAARTEPPKVDLSGVSTEDLLAEVRQRIA
jgi:transcriptional regulator with XRE-family HTH domain